MAAEQDPDARARAAHALAGGASQTEAARASGYSRMHVSRLLKDPTFVADVERAREQLVAAPKDEDEELALEVLRAVAERGLVEIARVAAAKAILAHRLARLKPGKKVAPREEPPPLVSLEGGDAAAADWLKSSGA